MNNLDPSDVRVASSLHDARRAIRFAHWRSDPVDRESLLNEASTAWMVGDQDRLRTRLLQLDLAGEDSAAFVSAIHSLLAAGEGVASADKARIDSFAFWAVQQLTVNDVRHFVREWLSHARKGRRLLAYRLVRRLGLEGALSANLVAAWQQFGDLDAIRLLVRVEGGLHLVDVDGVFRAFDAANGSAPGGNTDEYWPARVMERLLLDDAALAIPRAHEHPVAFIRAVGRIGDPSWLPHARDCFQRASGNPRVLGIAASVAGRLGDRTLLAMVESAADVHEAEFVGSHSWYQRAR